MADLPSGMVTFLFTDIEGSTPLWEREPDQMGLALARHHAIVRTAITSEGGHAYKTIGDAFQAAFALPIQAVAAALAAQRTLATQTWETSEPVRVRMGVHVGPAVAEDTDYSTTHTLNRVARIMAAGHGGQILLSSEVADLVRRDLPTDVTMRDMGTHRMKGLAHLEHLFQLVAPDLPAVFPPLKTLNHHPNNLPLQSTPLIGREKEIISTCALFRRADIRLVTLTGPGGTGKTRLALQTAAELVDEFSDGVWFVNLAPISDPELVATTIAQTLGVRETDSRPLRDSLQDYLHEKRLLLLLDNFEQVVNMALLVADLLAAAPHLKVLVTSRAALHLSGEREVAVPPLALPDRTRLPSLKRLTQYETVQLFIERAQAVQANFVVTNVNAPAVAEICHQLDGLPLAIELAAARIKLFPPQALLARLTNRLKLLTGGARDLLARQQTIRNTIDWSYQLLNEGETKLFTRLGVFVGGWTLEAAEAVCDADGDLPMDVVDGTAALMDQSLVRQDEGMAGEPRFTMLETIREYALDRLVESGEATVVRRRHVEYYVTLAAANRYTPKWLSRMEVEHGNLRAALTQALDQEALRLAGQLGISLEWFWFARGHISEGRMWLETLLSKAQAASLSESTHATVSRMAGYFAYFQGDYERAKLLFETSLMLFRGLADTVGIADLLINLGMVAEAHGDNTQARALVEESLALRRELGTKELIADSLYHLGRLTLFQSNIVSAHAFLEEALALFQAVGRNGMIPIVMGVLGYTALLEGEYQRAARLFRDALTLLQQQSNAFIYPYNLIGLAGVWAAERQAVRAGRMIGAAEGLAEQTGLRPSPGERTIWERIIASVRSQLDEASLAAAWTEGRAMTLEEAIAYALGEDA